MNTTEKIYIGVDVAKLHLDLDLPSGHRRFANSASGLNELWAMLPADAHLVCEASGGYELLLLRRAWSQQRPISLVPPQRVRAFARSQGQLAKTDRLDCRLLSSYARERCPPPTPAPQPLRTQVRSLLRARELILHLQRQEANHREHLGDEPLLRSGSDERLALFDRQRAQIETQIRTLLRTDSQAQACLQRLTAVRGVGEITAWTTWADLPELGSLRPGQAAALAGLAPQPDDSGQRSAPRHIQAGRASLRRVLYMAALTAARHNHILREVYRRLRARGKPAKVALVALARRLVELFNILCKNPNFQLAA